MSDTPLDPSTPFRSESEQLNAMTARNDRGEKRYAVDDGYRADVEAKILLGGSGARDRIGSSMTRVDTNGEVSEHVPLAVTFSDDDMQKGREIAALRAELAGLEKQASDMESRAYTGPQIDASGTVSIPSTVKAYDGPHSPDMVREMSNPLYRELTPAGDKYRAYVRARLDKTP